MIEIGNTVNVHYTGKLKNGEVFDSSEGGDTLEFTIGSGQIIPGFENAIIGKNIGDKLTIEIESKEAYGEYREDLIVKVQNDQLPGPVEVGQVLQADNGGSPVNVTVKEINEDHVLIDGNHPLSGKDLIFEIEVVSFQ